MRRRTCDLRRRRRFSLVSICLAIGLLGLMLIALFGFAKHPASVATLKNQPLDSVVADSFNLTEELLDVHSYARQLGDQMVLAKAYLVIAKENNNLQLAWDLSAQIRACQLLFSQVATRASPIMAEEAEPLIKQLASLIYQCQELHYDIATVIMKFKAQIQALEERASAATVQSTTFGQLAAEAVPKSLYCLGMQLTLEWAETRNELTKEQHSPALTDQELYHFVVFSDNILGTSVVINSTVCNSKYPSKLVFHLVTDSVNYGAMRVWFAHNDFKGATIEVQNIDTFTWLNASYVPVLKQLQHAETQSYYFKSGQESKNAVKFRNPKYLSMLNHLRFYIPEIYPDLKKVVFLDDDIVVQKDLTPLFSVDLHGNVNGAVETCLESFHRYHKYLNFSHPKIKANFDPDTCGWAFGMNIFDLVASRPAHVLRTHRASGSKVACVGIGIRPQHRCSAHRECWSGTFQREHEAVAEASDEPLQAAVGEVCKLFASLRSAVQHSLKRGEVVGCFLLTMRSSSRLLLFYFFSYSSLRATVLAKGKEKLLEEILSFYH